MQITFAMLWDRLNAVYPALETALYGGQPVRGIKLTPAQGEREPDVLYLDRRHGRIRLVYGCGEPVHLETGLTLEEIFNALQDAFNGLRDWDMETHLALIEGCGAQRLLDLSEQVLGNPITLMDPSFKLLAHTRNIASDSAIYQEVCRQGYLSAETVEFYALRGYLEELAQGGEEGAFHNEASYVSVIKALRVSGRVVGYLTMPCTEHPYSQGMAERFRCLAGGMEQCLEHELRSSDISRYMYEYFLLDLIDGKEQSPDAVAERLKYIGLPMQGRFRLLKVAGVREDPALGGYLARQIAGRIPNARVFPRQGAVLLFLPEERTAWALDALAPYLEEQGLSCGVSRSFGLLTDIRGAFRQAEAAVRLGRAVASNRTLARLGAAEEPRERTVFHYERFALHHMVEAAAGQRLISPHLLRLIAVDRREHAENLRVLYTFLTCERRPTQAAAALHMHRNNVIYRVGRVEEILGVSLEDPALRAELAASFCVLELIAYEIVEQIALNRR